MSDDVIVRLDKINDKLINIDQTLIRQEEQLVYHIKRTDLLEDMVKDVKIEIQPIKNHVAGVNGVLKFITIFGVILSIAVSIYKLLK